jgi:serine phosphatase RsbU (regulator of sigma subunit)
MATARQSSELERLELVLETLRAVHSVRSLDGILKLIVDTTIELTGTERGFIMLKDDTGQLTYRVARNKDKSDLMPDLKISTRLADKVFKTGQPVIVSSTATNLSIPSRQSIDELGLKAIACLPLELSGQMEGEPVSAELRGEVIGVLYVDSRSTSHRCTPNLTEALSSLVNQAAMVIENARLQRIMHEKRALEKELALAHQIQQQLLPKELPQRTNLDVASVNIPCRNVGGDYFDYMLFDDGRTGIVIGDVSGKGIPAALLMSTLQGIFYAQAFSSRGTAETVTKVNRYLVARSLENSYLTAFYGVISPVGQLTYTNAGHNPPILVRHNGQIERLIDGGLALGLFDFSDYSSGAVLFQDGDMLVLFSDGVTDAVNEAGDDFGEERLISSVVEQRNGSARTVLDRALDEIKSFSNRTDQQDDLTLMIIKFVQSQP